MADETPAAGEAFEFVFGLLLQEYASHTRWLAMLLSQIFNANIYPWVGGAQGHVGVTL